MLVVHIHDVVETAKINAASGVKELRVLTEISDPSKDVQRRILEAAELQLAKALSDVMLARHMASVDWADTVYAGEWE